MNARQVIYGTNTVCPDCGSPARLFMHPGAYAGTWECTNGECGADGECIHENRHVETVQVDFWPTPDIDSSYDQDVYVCDLCDCTIPLDQADPAVDRHDAMIDMQIDFVRGK